jgi:hypothetical protein
MLDRLINESIIEIFVHAPHGELLAGALVGAELAMGVASRLGLNLYIDWKVWNRPHTVEPAPEEIVKIACAILGEKKTLGHDGESFPSMYLESHACKKIWTQLIKGYLYQRSMSDLQKILDNTLKNRSNDSI